MKKKGSLYYLHPRHICSEIEGYGYEYSVGKALRNYGIYLGCGALAGCAFRLQPVYIIIMLLLGIVFVPGMVLSTYRNKSNQSKFWDAVSYMDQILTVFRDKKRYQPSLAEIKSSFAESPMYACLDRAEKHMLTSTSADAQQEAYQMIETDYGCLRMKNIHRYMANVQILGGDVTDAIKILQDDLRNWELRQQEAQMQRVSARNVVYGILGGCVFLELVILWAFYFYGMDLMHEPLVQICGVIEWVASLLLVRATDRKASVDWMDRKNTLSDEKILANYEQVVHFDKKKEMATSLRWAVIPAVFLIISIARHASVAIIVIMAALTVFVLFSWKVGYLLSYQDTVKEMRRAFPTWILDVALRMQTDSVQVALYGSYETAPTVLKPELDLFYEDLKEHPESIDPYLNFLKNFPIRGVDSFMRKIYSVYAGTSAQEQTAIMDLVQRNNYLMDEAEKAKNAEALRPLDEMGYRVMGVIGVKMMVEMVVMFMQMVDKITNF